MLKLTRIVLDVCKIRLSVKPYCQYALHDALLSSTGQKRNNILAWTLWLKRLKPIPSQPVVKDEQTQREKTIIHWEMRQRAMGPRHTRVGTNNSLQKNIGQDPGVTHFLPVSRPAVPQMHTRLILKSPIMVWLEVPSHTQAVCVCEGKVWSDAGDVGKQHVLQPIFTSCKYPSQQRLSVCKSVQPQSSEMTFSWEKLQHVSPTCHLLLWLIVAYFISV